MLIREQLGVWSRSLTPMAVTPGSPYNARMLDTSQPGQTPWGWYTCEVRPFARPHRRNGRWPRLLRATRESACHTAVCFCPSCRAGASVRAQTALGPLFGDRPVIANGTDLSHDDPAAVFPRGVLEIQLQVRPFPSVSGGRGGSGSGRRSMRFTPSRQNRRRFACVAETRPWCGPGG